MCARACVHANRWKKRHPVGPEGRVHIREDQCIRDGTKARGLSGRYVTRSEALRRSPRSAWNTWRIKATKEKNSFKGAVLLESVSCWDDVGISELLDAIIYAKNMMPLKPKPCFTVS